MPPGRLAAPPVASLTDTQAHALVHEDWTALSALLPARDSNLITYSRKVFIPLTRLCRDSCGYCTFAHHGGLPPGAKAYLTPEEVLEIAAAGKAAGCTEALFTLGDRPEARWPAAREHLAELGHGSTIEYVAAMCKLVLRETGLLPHTNVGLMDAREVALLRRYSVSQGLMLESASSLAENGGAHAGCVTKLPKLRLQTIERAGRLRVPFTTGVLLGIGETRAEVIASLLAIRQLHTRFGHVQEVIVQPFRAKKGTRLAASPDLPEAELLWACCAARLILDGAVPVQSPPNLSADPATLRRLLSCGVEDWGGVSPGVTPDHVNPEAAWPEIAELRRQTEAAGLELVSRLPLYPRYATRGAVQSRQLERWLAPAVAPHTRRLSTADGLARSEQGTRTAWYSGLTNPVPTEAEDHEARWLPGGSGFAAVAAWRADRAVSPRVRSALVGVLDEDRPLGLREVEMLLTARGADCAAVCAAANELRARVAGGGVSYAVVRNINYTNKCMYACTFCAFSKGRKAEELRGPAYELEREEVTRRTAEAWDRGATEVCMQGGIHPSYDGDTYLGFLRAARDGAPAGQQVHVHAFSPLEVSHGAATLGEPTSVYLRSLRAAGLGSLPGTAAEVLADPVRAQICPDKLTTAEWMRIVGEAHSAGLPTTSTLMFGHAEGVPSLARHLMRLRVVQARSLRRGAPARITEFVPLPFVHAEAPAYLLGNTRPGPTLREAVLVHAAARLCLSPLITNIQVSWTKMGPAGCTMALQAGANDLGGTLMNEHISRAAGASHGQEMNPEGMRALVAALPPDAGGARRTTWQRTTTYAAADEERARAADSAPALQPI